MDDKSIVALYWSRSETAITETALKYGTYLASISSNILDSWEDAQECVNDTYKDAWNSMPPHRPSVLSTYLGKITRRISIDRWRKRNAEKRGGGELPLVLDELEDCVSGSGSIEDEIVRQELVKLFNHFLNSLPVTERRVFLCRYWYMDSIQSIARQFGFSQSKVTSMLHRTRAKLRVLLEKEGY
ncbi:MAG TPA: sigma-70 family RNA polymerase sigma factor [Clostridiaceae bacterium]|nr:sigma-70 family RNA polymerase sigma factor [Clostridiaceae bacterium]